MEIKCPYTHRHSDLRKALLAKKKDLKGNYIIYFLEGSPDVHINKEHPYYHQIQGQIYLSKKDFGYLFVWTTVSHLLVRINKDPLWEPNVSAIENFYHSKFIPYVCSKLQ